jgi:L-alanine-DL-glutamate epimerase-like enolase superfamily enzyme
MAIGTLEIALWDIVAKIDGRPLYRVLADRFAPAAAVPQSIATYAAGGFYGAGDPVALVREEVRRWRELGFVDAKIKGGDPNIDPPRIEAALAAIDGRGRLALDLSCVFDAPQAVAYTRLVKQYHPWWIEEPCDPLDDQGYRAVSAEGVPVAGGENLFAPQEFGSFLTHARLPGPVVLMPDPPVCRWAPSKPIRVSSGNSAASAMRLKLRTAEPTFRKVPASALRNSRRCTPCSEA